MSNKELNFQVGTVWCGEAANRYVFSAFNYLEGKVEIGNVQNIPKQTFCLKLSLQKHNHSFGILGCQYVPDTSDHLLIRVGTTKLSLKDDAMNSGINDNYGKAVLQEALLCVEMNNVLGAGTLTFDRALIHNVYSNTRVFRILTRGLISFVCAEFECIDHLAAQQIIHTSINAMNQNIS
jgi:hypothetical protein